MGDDEFSEGRRRFLEACRLRRKHQQLPRGPEETIAGCGCFLRLSDRPHSSAVQIILLVVRHRWRRSGLGSFLLQVVMCVCVCVCVCVCMCEIQCCLL